MRFFAVLVIVACALKAVPSLADDVENDKNFGFESWYYQLSFGFNRSSVSGDLGNTLDQIGDLTGTSASAASLDLVGVYVPVGENLLVGAQLIGGGWISYGIDDQVNLYLTAASAQYFFDSIGKGAFFIGDVGQAKISYTESTVGVRTISRSGLGARFGVGYARPISSEARLFLSVTNTMYDFGGAGSVNALGFNAGAIW